MVNILITYISSIIVSVVFVFCLVGGTNGGERKWGGKDGGLEGRGLEEERQFHAR